MDMNMESEHHFNAFVDIFVEDKAREVTRRDTPRPANSYFALTPMGMGHKRKPSGVHPNITMTVTAEKTQTPKPPPRRGSIPWTAAAYSPSSTGSSPRTPNTPNSPSDAATTTVFRFSKEPTTSKDILAWCDSKVSGYRHVRRLDNFSTCWADGLAFCAIVHYFFPDAFDYDGLDPTDKGGNLELAFRTAEQRARVSRLLDVSDMLEMGDCPDSKCVYTYVQALYRRLRRYETQEPQE